jgi:hypothetical protein
MSLLRTTLLALLGLALPVGLALAVYLSSAGTITAAPVALPPAAGETIAQPSERPKRRETKRDPSQATQPSGGTSTVDDHGGATTTDNHGGNSGPGGGDDSRSGSSGSGSSGSGSSGSGSSGDD